METDINKLIYHIPHYIHDLEKWEVLWPQVHITLRLVANAYMGKGKYVHVHKTVNSTLKPI